MTAAIDTHVLSPKIPTPEMPEATAPGALELVDLLLRDRAAFLTRIEATAELLPTARALLVTSILSTAALGAALGAYRGGVQIAFAAVKLPLALLLTASLVAPALTGLGVVARAGDRPLDLQRRFERDLVLVLGALALGGLVTAALTPAIVLAEMAGLPYHELILTIVGACAIGGLAGLALFAGGMARRGDRGRSAASLAALALFAVVGAQMCWSLRPFLVRPRTEAVPFLRAIEGSLFESVSHSADSARGIYDEPSRAGEP